MNNDQSKNTKEVVESNATITTSNIAKYTGKKAPVINVSKLTTSKAAINALERIEVRCSWMKSEGEELKNTFDNSDDPTVKENSHKKYMKLFKTIEPLTELKKEVEEKREIIQKEKLDRVKNLEFPLMEL